MERTSTVGPRGASNAGVYSITVGGILDPQWAAWFAPMTLTTRVDPTGTPVSTLQGAINDQAALRGIVNRLWNLNLTVLELRRLPPANPKPLSDKEASS